MSALDPSSFFAQEAWKQQYFPVLWQPAHAEITVSKWGVPHPIRAGFVLSVGQLAGQIADYRLPLEDGREVHVREYGDRYTLHLDQVSALRNPLGHLLSDAPHWIIVGGILALVLGLLFSGDE